MTSPDITGPTGRLDPQAGTFLEGLWASLPIVLGYVPIAFAFGVAARGIGLTLAEAVALSLILYSGGAQFVALALIGSGAPFLVSAFTLIAMGLRHLLYGPTLMRRAGPGASRRHAWAWAWGLTDEVFGTALGALARGRRFSEPFMFGLGLGAYLAWASGTAMGAYAGSGALAAWPAVETGLGFMLPALFLALLLSVLSRAQLPVIGIAAVATIAVTLAWSGTAGLLAGMIAGAVAGVLNRRGDGGAP
ncbi:AzlC family ABC transporter permease [Frigidibacter sp. RF13]|uniref:AzlC family ABC transporter permease n=1 Tax=Frigidibacter sp. RF13 TaxID=2997340 RepID=UPI0022709FE3|nr:AzlC family ABC transporter permease [Frigidibacter sp. RF13]MCY1127700.1 AzlC family ABC transporter permease [Frigidibacter sp. RF13]